MPNHLIPADETDLEFLIGHALTHDFAYDRVHAVPDGLRNLNTVEGVSAAARRVMAHLRRCDIELMTRVRPPGHDQTARRCSCRDCEVGRASAY
jgi:hypothetical protein